MNISRPAENRRIKAEYQHIATRKDNRAAIGRAMFGWEDDYYRHWRSEGRNLGIMVNGVSEFFKGISEAIERSGSGRE
ncbi:hypothetical protein [uncultured Bifidobacterium sp.]|uniref:hypothetical protein n=1 Tax=uncultured Bifidobacterium sp. TaxID=165187 RepID=UPI0025E46024|nr:hypothetical protein [uncultured Bifidobacterium sp.]